MPLFRFSYERQTQQIIIQFIGVQCSAQLSNKSFIVFIYMNQTDKTCFTCQKVLGRYSWYCCNRKQLCCSACSGYKCPKCKKTRNNEYLPSPKVNKVMAPSKLPRGNRCDNCDSSETIARYTFFEEKRCKKYYCHSCMEIFYSTYNRFVQKFLKENGESIEMEVELKCGCQIPKSQIIAYLRKYCIDCSEQINKKSIVLTNQCIIMVSCIRRIQQQLITAKFNLARKNKIGQILQKINSLIAVCTVCDMKIDGSLRTEWELVDNMCICSDCLRLSKENQQQFYVSSEKKRKEERYQHPNPYQIINKKSQQNQCKFCSQTLKKQDLQNLKCKKCMNKNQKIIRKEPNQLLKQQKLHQSSGSQLQQLQQKQKQKQPLSSPLKSKVKFPLQKIKDQQIPSQLSQKKSKPQISSPIKQHQIQDDIPDEQFNAFPSKSSMQRAARQFQNVSFSLQYPPENTKELKICCQCKSMYEDTFITYKRQKDRQQSIRIAQIPEQISKYTKQNRIQIYCKGCYLQLKFKLKLKKVNDIFRIGDYRRTGSMPKPPVKEIKTQSKYSKILLQDSYYHDTFAKFDPMEISRKFQKKESAKKTCKQCQHPITEKYGSPIENLCKFCYQRKKPSAKTDKIVRCSDCNQFVEYNYKPSNQQILCQICKLKRSNRYPQITCSNCGKTKSQVSFRIKCSICKQCEILQLQSSMKKKQQQKYIQYRCKRCGKLQRVKQTEKGKLQVCANCLISSHTIHRARIT